MPSNIYFEQPYAGTEGKVLLADRFYTATINTTFPTTRQNGATPAGYTDMGAVEGSDVMVEKAEPTLIDISTGLFEVLRGQVAKKDGDVVWKLQLIEYEPLIWASLTGDVVVSVGAGTGIYVGGRPLIQKAILCVGQNPASGSEFHHWNPKANLSYDIKEANRFRYIDLIIRLLKFTDGGDAAGLARDFRLNKF